MNDSKNKPADGASDSPIPKAVVSRLSLYLRELQRLMFEGQETISSTQVGKLLGLTDAQVRKDLAYFGQFGYPGIGYRCEELIQQIKNILGTDQDWPIAIVGIGNLGRALLGYRGFSSQGFRIVSALDVDEKKVGQQVEGVRIEHLDNMSKVIQERGIRLGVISVPAEMAQDVADRLVASGIDGILNFAPFTISTPSTVHVVGVDLAIEMEQLSFAVVNRPSNA